MKAYIPLNKPSRDLLLDLINETNSISPPLTFDQVIFDPATALAGNLLNVFRSNTKLIVKDLSKSGYENSRIVYYNRVEISALFAYEKVTVKTDFSTMAEAIEALNDTYDMRLSQEEIGYMEFVGNNRVDLVIGDSFVYLPGSKLSIIADTDISQLEDLAQRVWYYANFTLPNDVML